MDILRRLAFGGAKSLCRAIEAGEIATVEALLQRYPDLANARSGKYDETPLHCVSRAGYLEIAGLLLEYGAAIEARDDFGDTPLHRAAYNGHSGMVELLIGRGGTVDVRGRLEETPLFSAAVRGHVETVKTLIYRGAYVNAANSIGYTPIHVATLHGHREVVEVLMRSGADMYTRANDGVTPLDLGRRGGVRVMMEFAEARPAAAAHDATTEAETPTASSILKKARDASLSDDLASAVRLYDEALCFCRAASDSLGEGNAIRGLAFLEALTGRKEDARLKYEEAIAIFRNAGHRAQEAYALIALGNLVKSVTADDAAMQFFRKAAAMFESLRLFDLRDFALAEISELPDRAPIAHDSVAALERLIGRHAIRTAPAKCSGGRLDYSYSNLDPNTKQPMRSVKRCLLIESVEPGRIVAKRVSLVPGEMPGPSDIVSQVFDEEQWFDDAWSEVGPNGEVPWVGQTEVS